MYYFRLTTANGVLNMRTRYATLFYHTPHIFEIIIADFFSKYVAIFLEKLYAVILQNGTVTLVDP